MRGHRRFGRATGIAVLAVLALALAAGPAAAGTDVSGCTTIDSAGTYNLTTDVTNDSASTCINITTNDVILDGEGHVLDGSDTDSSSYGVEVAGVSSNVTVRDVNVTRWDDGVHLRSTASQVTVTNSIAHDNGNSGIYVDGDSNTLTENTVNQTDSGGPFSSTWGIYLSSSDSTVSNNTVTNNDGFGIELDDGSDDNMLTGNNASSNSNDGIIVDSSDDNTLTDTVLNSNTNGLALNDNDGSLATDDSLNTTIRNITVDSNSITGIYLALADNTTLRNATVTANGDHGLEIGVANTTVTNSTVSSNTNNGIHVTFKNNTLRDLTLTSNGKDGLRLLTANNNTVQDVNASDNTNNGTTLRGANDNTLRNLTVQNNGEFAVGFDDFFGDHPTGNQFSDVDIGASTAPNTTLTFRAENVTLAANSSAPSNDGDTPLDRYFEATNTTSTGYLNVTLHYEDGDVGDVDESTVALQRYNGTGWESVSGSTVDTAANNVSANITSFSTFGAFGQTPANFSVNITETNDPVTEGETLQVNGTVNNTGQQQDSQELNLTDFDGTEVDTATFDLSGGETATFNFTWATSSGDAATDNVTVASNNDTDRKNVTVDAPAYFDVTITETNEPVVEGETLRVNGTVNNTGTLQAQRTVNFTDFSGTEVDSASFDLAGGEQGTFNFTWNTQSGDGGTDSVTVASPDENDSSTVTVDNEAYFDVSIAQTNAPVTEGETLRVDGTVDNTGDDQGQKTVNLTDFGGTEVDSASFDLSGGEQGTFNFTWNTRSGDAGSGAVTVASPDENDTSTITVDAQSTGGGSSSSSGGVNDGEETIEDGIDAEPDVAVEVGAADDAPGQPGTTVDVANTEVVDQVEFESASVEGSIQVTEYDDPPESVSEAVTDAVASDGGNPSAHGERVLAAADISPSAEDVSGVTVRMTVPRDELVTPDSAVVAHETDDGWESLETSVADTSAGTVTLTAETDSFSLFAVVDTPPSETRATTPTPTATPAPTPTTTPTPADDGQDGDGAVQETVSVQTPTPTPTATPAPTDGSDSGGGFFAEYTQVVLVVVVLVAHVVALFAIRRAR
ncbi:MAG: right-handed parallel beta-helix repeat-containing protein [Haloarculaceae archaeon]